MEDYKKKVFLNCDTLVIDGTHFTVDNMGSVPDELHPRQFSEKKVILISFLVGYIVNSNHSPTGTHAVSSSKVITLRARSRRISGPKQITARMQQQQRNCCMPHLQEKPKTWVLKLRDLWRVTGIRKTMKSWNRFFELSLKTMLT